MMAKPKYYKANQGFATTLDDEPLFVQKGELVSADHPLLKGREDLFEPAESFGRFDTSGVEQATNAPGEKRGKPARKRRASRSSAKKRATAAPESKPSGLTTKDIEPGSQRSAAD